MAKDVNGQGGGKHGPASVRVCPACGKPAPSPVRVRIGARTMFLCGRECARPLRTHWSHARKLGLV